MSRHSNPSIDADLAAHRDGFIEAFLTRIARERARVKPDVLGEWLHHVILSKCRTGLLVELRITKISEELLARTVRDAGAGERAAVLDLSETWRSAPLDHAFGYGERLVSLIPGKLVFVSTEDLLGGLFVRNDRLRAAITHRLNE